MALVLFGIVLMLWVLLAYRLIGLGVRLYWAVAGKPRELFDPAWREGEGEAHHAQEAGAATASLRSQGGAAQGE